MIYFCNPTGPETLQAMRTGPLGFIDTPKQGNIRPSVRWCADNGCFGKGYPGDEAWLDWLRQNAADAGGCLFATAPDVVGNAAATLIRSLPWLAKIREMGFPAAFVAQNGQESLPVLWHKFDALFIGGTVECPEHGPTLTAIKTGSGCHQRFFCPACKVQIFDWKLGKHARDLVREAKLKGKWVHMGRVNSRKRMLYAAEIGCDSVDGTYLIKAPDKNLPKLLSWFDALPGQTLAA